MKFGVVIFPGSNCDDDMLHVLGDTYSKPVTKLWHKDRDLQGCDFIVLPGGFSFGDYLRSGALARYSPIMEEVIDFAANGGFVMGVCNGFQILCESGLLPGALLRNENRLFQCENVHIKAEHANSRFTAHVPAGKALKIPIAHGEGRYHADAATLNAMNKNGQILYRYCNENGEVTPKANPNGSLENIAGVCNEAGNVFGMMPHPERAASEDLSNTDGRYIFDSLVYLGVIMEK
ncbi:MAG: phosphoribosylformylglycinamidine synthase subunit PurQ [Flavobacteriaceae bacterium]|nr:phosphoribosylformylglycinamidine synthase subunit PurQ [Flavobacteriaceae bacterium]